ncbi:MAG: glycoside hydrolase family 3 C-terminal domain-containing protein, partial [Lachnoclostridium sp.]|jgi:beta-glucosidase|nr:glycoside hydrolase family 3 C-terminal domain-containing protein [Lachnoclostridium sp.]
MGAYNCTNGEPCCASKKLLVDILRGEWGFNGHVVSDCWAIKDFHEGHLVTSTPIESVALAMNRGCDLNCGNLYGNLLKAVEQGLVTEETIEKAVVRLFTTRMKLGLFDASEKVPYNKIEYSVVDCKKHQDLNEEAARKSVVLLKNHNNFLPLDKDKIKTIGVVGPNANSRRALVGNYEGTASEYITVLEGIQKYVGDDIRVLYSEGCHMYKEKTSVLTFKNDRESEVRAVANEADLVIAVMGLDADLEGEEGDTGNEYGSGDKPNLNFPGLQQNTLEVLKETGKPIVLIVLSGSALAFTWADENAEAILQGWYPGARGGKAIAEILFGDVSPEGKLPLTFYRSTDELPEFTDYSMKGRTYRYMKTEPLYPFGYGLSYTDMVCSKAEISSSEIEPDKDINCSVLVTNNGKMKGAEAIQVYVRAIRENAPNLQLKSLKKVTLNPGESKTVNLTLKPEDFALFDEKGNRMLNHGDYEIYIGSNLPDARSTALTGKTPEKFGCAYQGESVEI